MKKKSNGFTGSLFFVFALQALLIGGGFLCDRDVTERELTADGRVVARVNESVLLKGELDDSLPEFFGKFYSVDEKNDYIEQWVQSELLYQRALEEGLQKDREIQKKIGQFQRMLLEQEVLRRHLEGKVVVSDEEISEYYTKNKEVFVRDEDEYRVNKLVFQDEEIAREVVGELKVAPERYDELILGDAYNGKITAVDLGFYPASGLKEAFGAKISGLEVGQLSQPIILSSGNCYALRMVEYREKGSTRELSEVEDQIRSILLRSKSEKAKQVWLEELKKGADVEIAAD